MISKTFISILALVCDFSISKWAVQVSREPCTKLPKTSLEQPKHTYSPKVLHSLFKHTWSLVWWQLLRTLMEKQPFLLLPDCCQLLQASEPTWGSHTSLLSIPDKTQPSAEALLDPWWPMTFLHLFCPWQLHICNVLPSNFTAIKGRPVLAILSQHQYLVRVLIQDAAVKMSSAKPSVSSFCFSNKSSQVYP